MLTQCKGLHAKNTYQDSVARSEGQNQANVTDKAASPAGKLFPQLANTKF